jgi:hypothetical protein
VENYRFNNEPNQERPGTNYDYYEERDERHENRGRPERPRRDKDENNYKFRKNNVKNEYYTRTKPSGHDNEEWDEEDSQEDGHHESRSQKDGERSGDLEGRERDFDGRRKGFNKALKSGSMQKGWQKNIDNFGYIERKTYTKTDEGKPLGTIYRGQQYFVRVEDSGKEAQNGPQTHKPKWDRDETPEYRPKQ